MKFLKEEHNAYQYKGYTVILTSSGYRIKDGKGNWVSGEFDTDVDAKEHIDDLNESFDDISSYKFISSKSVEDSDGFMTDYTWYEAEDGTHVFVFGDNDIYKPEDGYFDHTCDSQAEAQEWFDSYNGFAEDEFVVTDEELDTKDKDVVKLNLSGNMIEIPIEDNSEVGELGHPIQQGIGDPRAKREKNLKEATAVLDKPLSTFNGTLSSVLLAHKDEIDVLFDTQSAVEFLDKISPEVKDKSYLETVKKQLMLSRKNPVAYFYNIILKGDGDGTEKGGAVTKKSKIRRWAKESVSENKWEPGDSVTLWWDNPAWSKTSPCYASCSYWGKRRDGKYKFISDTYGWTFLLDVDAMTVTTPQGKVHPVNNDSGWLKTELTENGVSSKLPEDIDNFLQELAQSQGMFDYNDIIAFTPSETSLSTLRQLMIDYKDALEDEDAEDIAKQVAKIIKGELTESVNEFAHEVAIAMQHLMNDIGRDPTDEDFAEDVVLEMEKSTPEEELPTDPLKYREWANAIMCEVSRQLNSLKESYNVQYYQIFSNPEKPTDNGKMIAQAGTEDEAKEKGDKLVGKGNYLVKAVCDDGKVRDVDLHDYFNDSKDLKEYYRGEDALDDILSWLQDHKQAWDDFTVHFSDVEDEDLTYDMVVDWISEHETLYDDYLSFFHIEEKLEESKSINEDLDDWSLAVYNNDTLLKDGIWSVSDALEFIHDNGGNVIKKFENGEETVIWKDGKAVGDFIAVDLDDNNNTVYAKDGEDVPTHKALPPFDAKKWYYGESVNNEAPLKNYKITYFMDSLDDNVMSGPNTTATISATSEKEAEKKLQDRCKDSYYIVNVVKIEELDEAYVENPRELMRNKREDGAVFDEESGKWVKIDYDEDGTPVEIIVDEAIELTAGEMKAKYGTDNPDIINAGKPEEERVSLKNDTSNNESSYDEDFELDQNYDLWDCVKLNTDQWVVIVDFENYEYLGLTERSIKRRKYEPIRFTEQDIKWLVEDEEALRLVDIAKRLQSNHSGSIDDDFDMYKN